MRLHFTPLDFLFFGIVLTASADVLLAFQIGGTIRVTQILCVLFIFLSIASNPFAINNRDIGLLIVFAVINAAFIMNNSYPLRAVAYALWLLFNVMTVFGLFLWLNTERRLFQATRLYLLSAACIAFLGIVLWMLERIGIVSPVIRQPGRINGLSYEPSYFATYLAPFFISSAYYLERRIRFWGRLFDIGVFFVILIALILSSSRMGLLAILFWGGRLICIALRDLCRAQLGTSAQWISLALVSLGSVTFLGLFYFRGLDWYEFFQGTGLMGTAAHSVDERSLAIITTWEVFAQSPLLGCSLGGVAAEVGELLGMPVQSMMDAKTSEGASVFMEVLAGTGIVGGLCLFAAMAFICKDAWKYVGHPQIRILSRGMVWGLVVLLGLLQLNQNILRPYLWYHIALVLSFASVGNRFRKLRYQMPFHRPMSGHRHSGISNHPVERGYIGSRRTLWERR
jgi:hypothetical protein